MAISHKTRYAIFLRDRFTCMYCGNSAPDVLLEIDHVVPRSRGGGDEPGNLAAACHDCNTGKSDDMPPRWFIAKVTRTQRNWIKKGQWHSAEADEAAELAAIGAYVEAFGYLEELPARHVLHCMMHVLAERFPARPYGPDLVIATATCARSGYGSRDADTEALG